MQTNLLSPSREREYVVLLDSEQRQIGQADKYTVHTDDTPLHSAFSIFLFNRKGETLLQQRAWSKRTWPGIWSNACCGHPQPGESLIDAAQRRLRTELNIDNIRLRVALPQFRYRAEYLGVVENECCPVLIGLYEASPTPNPDEVADFKWVPWQNFAKAAQSPENSELADLSPWSLWEAEELNKINALELL